MVFGHIRDSNVYFVFHFKRECEELANYSSYRDTRVLTSIVSTNFPLPSRLRLNDVFVCAPYSRVSTLSAAIV
jgi:hypothetical protein